MHKILLIENDSPIEEKLYSKLESLNLKVTRMKNYEDTFRVLKKAKDNYSLIIHNYETDSDLIIDRCLDLRKIDEKILYFIISSEQNQKNKTKALVSGADEYMEKPFDFNELCARILNYLDRSSSAIKPHLSIGNISINEDEFTITANSKVLDLTTNEFKLMKLLMKNGEKVTTRETILSEIWDVRGYEIMSNSIDVHISNLRNKLKKAGLSDVIKTRRGFGYFISP